MPNLFDYLTWRGDLSMSAVPFCPVDALILSTLSYIHFEELVPSGTDSSVTIRQAAREYLALPQDQRGRCRCPDDLKLLAAMAAAPRFSHLQLLAREERFVPEQELQFGALAILLENGTAFLAFRGTDSTLVGWKEDFNMSFMEAVPAQLAAADYVSRFVQAHPVSLILGGHSKGGNLAVFAGTTCAEQMPVNIQSVYTFDSPGFPPNFLVRPGYEALLPRLHAFLPQSSIVGMLLERKEPYTVVRSSRVGPLQHDPYSWQILGGDFVRLEEVTATSRFADRTLTCWLASLTPQQREQVVDLAYDLISSGAEFASPDAFLPHTLFQPQNLAAMLRFLKDTPDEDLKAVASSLERLIRTAAQAWREERQGTPEP